MELIKLFSYFSYRIRHNNKGTIGAPWYLESIVIKDVERESKKHIPAQIWLRKKNLQAEFDIPGINGSENNR